LKPRQRSRRLQLQASPTINTKPNDVPLEANEFQLFSTSNNNNNNKEHNKHNEAQPKPQSTKQQKQQALWRTWDQETVHGITLHKAPPSSSNFSFSFFSFFFGVRTRMIQTNALIYFYLF
jgi:hypothetical protein